MTDQTSPVTNTPKVERSANYVVSRLSYDSLISATKLFVHNFNSLSEEEKLEFKSLTTYVKQLEKCLPPKNKQISKPKKAPTVVAPVVSDAPVQVTEEKVVEPVKAKRTTKKVETKDVSPTEIAVTAVTSTVAAPVETKEEKKTVVKKTQQTKTK
jgi:hypothetical protein